MIKFLFGKAGSGKSHIGEAANLSYGFYFHDADRDLPDAFRKAVESGGGVTDTMREDFVMTIIATINRLAALHRDLCICQALIRDRARVRIQHAIPAVEFVWVDAPEEVISSRLESRRGHVASSSYSQRVNSLFEHPTVAHARFENDGDAAKFARQMTEIFGAQVE